MAGEFILLVDDEEQIRRVAEMVLTRSGYQTVVAATGQEALALIEKRPPDLLLADIRMPGMDGLELFNHARKLKADLVGVFMTAYGSIDVAVKSMQLGVSGFLVKPFTGSELERAIEDALNKFRITQEFTRLRLLSVLSETRRLINTEYDLKILCQSLVNSLAQETGSDYCAIFLNEETGLGTQDAIIAQLKPLASLIGPKAAQFSPRTFPAAELAARTLEQSRTLSLKRASQPEPQADSEPVPGAIIGVPLLIAGRKMGSLVIMRADTDQQFSIGESEMFEILAVQLAALLDNQRLQASLAERDEQLRLFASQFVSAQEDEKRKLAERIRSDLLPALTGSRQNIQSFLQKARPSASGDLLKAEETLHNLVNQTKKLAQQLRPANLTEFGLNAALRQYVNDLKDMPQTTCRPVFRTEGEEPPRLDGVVEIALFRAVQEAVDSACSRASESDIVVLVRSSGLRNKPNLLELEISDTVQSLDLQSAHNERRQSRVGLLAMQERIRMIGAACEIKSQPETGTRVIIKYSIPASIYEVGF